MVHIELSDLEKAVLTAGINEWGGPAMCTDDLAVAMGFADARALHTQRPRLLTAVRDGSTMRLRDWARVLVLTEFAFASDVFGSGYEWSTTTGLGDVETLSALRGLQRRLAMAGAERSQLGPADR